MEWGQFVANIYARFLFSQCICSNALFVFNVILYVNKYLFVWAWFDLSNSIFQQYTWWILTGIIKFLLKNVQKRILGIVLNKHCNV